MCIVSYNQHQQVAYWHKLQRTYIHTCLAYNCSAIYENNFTLNQKVVQFTPQ